jgi:hypothetical protein
MSKIVSGLTKAVKGVFKGVKKVFNAITDSTLGKVIVAAAVIYFGAAALAAWGGGAAGAGGTTAASTAAGGAAGEVVAAAAPAAGGATGAGITSTGLPSLAHAAGAAGTANVGGAATGGWAAAEGAGAGLAAQGAAGTVGQLGQSIVEGAPTEIVSTAGASQGGSALGLVGQSLQGVGTWANTHPILAAVGLNALAGAFTPTAGEEREEEEKRYLKRLEKNTSVGGINTSLDPNGKPLTHTGSGNPVYNNSGGLVQMASGGS